MTAEIQSISLYPISVEIAAAAETVSVPTLLAVSHSMEETVMRHALDGVFYAGFQRFSSFLPQANRFRRLASRCKKVYVFGYEDAPAPRIENLEYVRLEQNAPLTREWFIIFQQEQFNAALFTRQINMQAENEFGRGRLYQGKFTFENAAASAAARLLEQALNLAPAAQTAAPIPAPFNAYVQEFSAYMERAQSRIKNLYENLSNRTAKLERLEEIVRRMVSRQAWDDALQTLEAPQQAEAACYKKTLSVMFTDIQGFTPLFNTARSNEVTALLNRYFNIIATTVYQHHGDIDKFLGDGALAFFEDAQEAVNAAEEIQARLHYFNAQNAAHLGLQLNTRIGIATGECVIARVGSEDRRETSLFGDTVNIASRLQTQSPVNGLAIDDPTHERIGASLRFHGQDAALKGKGIQHIYTLQYEDLKK
ncbi:MAG: hypothetical protein Fur002_02560 [Anaerolineales bacterium]